MAKPATFTWERERGQWKSYYKGVRYRAPKGTLKKELPAWWTLKLQEIHRKEGEAERQALEAKLRHREQVLDEFPDYRKCLEGWFSVKSWSDYKGDGYQAAIAASRIEKLYEQIDKTDPTSDDEKDWGDQLTEDDFFPATLPRSTLDKRDYESCSLHYDYVNSSPAKDAALPIDEMWRQRLAEDRVRHEKQRETDEAEKVAEALTHLQGCVDAYVARRVAEADVGEIARDHAKKAKWHLAKVIEYAPEGMPVAKIDEQFVDGFRLWLLDPKQKIKRTYAKGIRATFVAFVNWLHETAKQLTDLPKNLTSDSQKIAASPEAVVPRLSKDTVLATLMSASDRTRLFLLLGLNCGMSQKDMADLRPSEVDWNAGTIRRKRSKTKDEPNVPTVTHKLWPETLQLLKKHQNNDPTTSFVLTTRNGGYLGRSDSGSDPIALLLRAVRKSSGVKCSIGDFKKLGASLLDDHPDHYAVATLYLGHRPDNTRGKHYVPPAEGRLGNATDWLREEIGINLLLERPQT